MCQDSSAGCRTSWHLLCWRQNAMSADDANGSEDTLAAMAVNQPQTTGSSIAGCRTIAGSCQPTMYTQQVASSTTTHATRCFKELWQLQPFQAHRTFHRHFPHRGEEPCNNPLSNTATGSRCSGETVFQYTYQQHVKNLRSQGDPSQPVLACGFTPRIFLQSNNPRADAGDFGPHPVRTVVSCSEHLNKQTTG